MYFYDKISKKPQKLVTMTQTELIQKAYHIIGNATPMASNCGALCGAAWCQGDEETGMLLFPGEQALVEDVREFTVTKTWDGRPLLLCSGRCQRERRPLSCRIFPFAWICDKGRYRMIADPRASILCPLYKTACKNKLNRTFTLAVYKAGKFLFEDAQMREFMEYEKQQIDLYREEFLCSDL